MSQPSLSKDEELLPDSTLHWISKSRKHRNKFEKLMKIKSKNLKRIGPAAVCFDNDFIIGRGSGGTCVYIGLWEDGSEVAVKKVLKSSCEKMAKNECKFVNLAKSTNSRHLVRCRYFEEIGDFYHFVLDLFEETLKDYVEEQSQTKESLEDNGPVIIKELLTGLQALHCGEQKIVHMDLKPLNILVDIEGHMHLTDFGISRILPEGESTVSTETIGTKGWRAVETLPKQPNCRVKHRRRSDIHVMGMICFYILTKGKHPFGKTSDERTKNLEEGRPVDHGEISSPSARELISWMLEHDIKKRPHVDEALKHPYLSDFQPYIPLQLGASRMTGRTVKTVKIECLNAHVYRTVCNKLNLNIDGKDWKTLAGKMGYSNEFVKQLQRLDDPADGLLVHWGTKSGNDVTKLIELLLEMERSDITEQLESEHI